MAKCGVELVEQADRSMCVRDFSFGPNSLVDIVSQFLIRRRGSAASRASEHSVSSSAAQSWGQARGRCVPPSRVPRCSDGPIPPEIRALANPAMLGLPFVHAANFEPSPELLDEAKGLIDALRSGEGIDALLARHEEVMREFRLDAVYDHKDD